MHVCITAPWQACMHAACMAPRIYPPCITHSRLQPATQEEQPTLLQPDRRRDLRRGTFCGSACLKSSRTITILPNPANKTFKLPLPPSPAPYRCSEVDQCCEDFETCVSCCLEPKHGAAALAPVTPKFAKNSNAGMWGDAFEYCSGVCRSHGRRCVGGGVSGPMQVAEDSGLLQSRSGGGLMNGLTMT